MPADDDPKAASPPLPRVSLLRCLLCGHTVECQPEDLLHYINSRWPQCCGQVMPLFLPVDPTILKPEQQPEG